MAETQSAKSLGLWSVVALGVGSMVGAGIFALLGLVGAKAGAAAWVSFLISGVVALLAGYSYARLSATFPSSGGIVEFLVRGLGNGVWAGTFSLMYYVTLVIGSAMVAKAFGAYADRLLFSGDGQGFVWADACASALVIALAFVNVVSVNAVGRIETLIVGIKLAILVIFMAAALTTVDPALLSSAHFGTGSGIAHTLGLTFLAYAGFGIMANAAGDVPDARRTIPRAFFIAIIIVMLLYLGLAVAVFGSLPLPLVETYKETVLAEAAKPIFGNTGFVVMSLAALLSTASAVNSNLFGEMNVAFYQARFGQLPDGFNRKLWNNAAEGFVLSLVVILLIINFMDLSAIASLTSLAFILCYLAVHAAHYRTAAQTGGSRLLIALGFLSLLAIFVVVLAGIAMTTPVSVVLFCGFIVICAGAQLVLKRARDADEGGSGKAS